MRLKLWSISAGNSQGRQLAPAASVLARLAHRIELGLTRRTELRTGHQSP